MTRVYRSRAGLFGAFGTQFSLDLEFCVAPQGSQAVNLVDPVGRRILFTQQPDGSFANLNLPAFLGSSLTLGPGGTYSLRYKNGVTWQFDLNNCLVQITNRNSDQVNLSRDASGNIVQITGPAGRSINLTYSTVAGRRVVTSATGPLGRAVQYVYTTIGSNVVLQQVVDPEGGITRYNFAFVGFVPSIVSIVSPKGTTVVQNSYNIQGRVSLQTLPDGSTFNFTYTIVGGVVTAGIVTNPAGKIFSCRFNGQGIPIQLTSILGQVQLMNRQPGTNLIVGVVDALGRETAVEYDDNGNVTRYTQPDGTFITYTYDPVFNMVTTVTDPLGQVTTLGYDALGNLTSVTDPLGKVATLVNNAFGQPISFTDPLGNVTEYQYDGVGNLISAIDPLGNAANLTYDAVSRVTSTTNPLGNTATYEYDGLDRLTTSTAPLGDTVRFAYDPNSNLTSVTDGVGNLTSYTYDSRDRLVVITDPLGQPTTLAYDATGNIVEVVDRLGRSTTFAHADDGRLIFETFSDGSTISYDYDATGKPLEMRDSAGGTLTFAYDALDRVVKHVQPAGSVEYTYDSLSRRTSATVSGRAPINYTYDALSRLVSVERGVDSAAFTYDAIGRVTNVTRSNGADTEIGYDPSSRVTGIDHLFGAAVLSSMSYEYDAMGNRVKFKTDSAQPLISQSDDRTFGGANRLLTSGATTVAHDAAGNVTELAGPGGTTTLTWDSRNRLVSLVGPGVTAVFTYDALNRRLSKTVNDVRTDYLYDSGNIIQEVSGGEVVADYLTGLGLDAILARSSAGETSFLLRDALGSVTLLTDGSGAVVNRYFYEPFGQTTVVGAAENPFQFTGRELDETGLYYYRSRYYDPVLGRFLSEDTIGFLGRDANLFAYVRNNPVNLADPDGQNGSLFDRLFGGGVLENLFGRPVSQQAIKEFQDPDQVRLRNLTSQVLANGGTDLIGSAIGFSTATGLANLIGP